jgi:exonuclease SbcC
MQIERLRLVNFRQHERTELEFGSGLTGIIGPNGAGKTTLLEAIAWVMYGTKAARGTRDSLRRRGAPPRSRVEVEMDFSLGAHHYRINRSLNSAELYQDGSAEPIANSLDSVTETVTRLLGMTRDEFFNTYFTGQKELAVMSTMTGPERAQFLSRVLGYERIRTAQDRLKEMRTALRSRLRGLDESLVGTEELAARLRDDEARLMVARSAEDRTTQVLAAAEAALAEIGPRWHSAQELREQFQALEGDRRVLVTDLANRRERCARSAREAASAARARAEMADLELRLAPLAALRSEADELEKRARAASLRRQAVARRDAAAQRQQEIAVALERLPEESAHQQLHDQIAATREKAVTLAGQINDLRASIVRDRTDAESRRNGLLAQFEDLKSQRDRLAQLGAEGVCPTCSRPLGEEFEQVLGLLDRQLEEVRSNGRYYKGRIEQLGKEPPELASLEAARRALETDMNDLISRQGRTEAELAERRQLEAERDRLARAMADLDAAAGGEATVYDLARHDEIRSQISALEPVALQAERLRAEAARAEALAGESEAAATALRDAEAELVRLEAAITAVPFKAEEYEQLRRADAEAAAAQREAELARVRARGEHEAAVAAVEASRARQAEAEARRRERAATASRLLLHDELDRALTDLRTDLNQTLRPELSELASAFVRDLTNGRYTELELDEDYLATLMDEGDPKPVISGGEEDVANLALRLAISQMIADRAGQPLSLLVLDEIFGSLDEERRGAVVELLRGLADRFPQVILITHVESVREGFDRIIRVGYDVSRGVAIVTDETGGTDVAA